MKTVIVGYTGYWTTSLEVPDDWELTHENAIELITNEELDFDFQDGGADWRPDFVAFETGPELTLE